MRRGDVVWSHVLDTPPDTRPAADELVRAAMAWHFDPETGSPFWLSCAAELDFEPRTEIRGHADLCRFPDVSARLRDVPAAELVPRGYGDHPDLVGVFESGGTTGPPKRVVCLRDWLDRLLAWDDAHLDAAGFPREVDWLGLVPTGPHIVGELVRRIARHRGGVAHVIDLDPRWVKRLLAQGRTEVAAAYSEHLVEQARHVLRSQRIGVLTVTPPLLELMARDDELVDLINTSVRAIRWGGTRMDADTLDLYADVFPGVTLFGHYGSTMTLGFAGQRQGTADCVFDPFTPYTTFAVVDPQTRRPVAYGERGQVVTHHVSKSFLLPNNLERDLAVRVPAPDGQPGDSVADVGPVPRFENETVIEGVY
jgi:acyl-CoA synthetase (AMP-forming)/AMP-acid ligase II